MVVRQLRKNYNGNAFHCELNPIELIWLQLKHYIKSYNWAKCVEHVKRIEDDYAKKYLRTSALPANGDQRYVVDLQSDADYEMSDEME